MGKPSTNPRQPSRQGQRKLSRHLPLWSVIVLSSAALLMLIVLTGKGWQGRPDGSKHRKAETIMTVENVAATPANATQKPASTTFREGKSVAENE